MSAIEAKIQVASPSRGVNDLRFNNKIDKAHRELTQTTFEIHGVGELSMNQTWEWICIKTANKDNLKEICDIPGAPSIRTVFHWRRKYPTFDQILSEAEDIRAYLLAEEATDTGRGATQETAQAAKVAFTALTWRASKLDPGKFADKKIEEHKFDFSDAATAELKARVQAMALAHPHLVGIAHKMLESKAPPKVIDVPALEESPPG